jgi:hypothetical protein
MAASIRAALLAGLLPVALPAAAGTIACHVDYGGETRVIEARPTSDPHSAPAIAIGSFFRFRVVFRDRPADLASIKVIVYADRDDGPVPIHQGTWGYPPPGPEGFTGRQWVYEPLRDGELGYRCALRPDGGER